MLRPSSFAVLRLIASSNFRLHHRPVGGFGAFEHAPGVHTDLTICIGSTDAIADKAASRGKFAKVVHRGQRIACCQRDKLLATSVKERVGGHGKRLDMLRGYTFECRLNLLIGARR